MADKTPRLYLEHIREAIDLTERYARGRQRPDLDHDPMLRQAIEVIQDGWLSLDPGQSWLIVGGVTVAAGLLAVGLFRWE